MASACSFELPGTGLDVTSLDGSVTSLDASVPSPETSEMSFDAELPAAHESGPDAMIDEDAMISSPQDGALEPPLDAGDSSVGAPGRDAAASQGSVCTLDGRFALRVAFDVNWVGTQFASIVPIIAKGEGELSFVVLMELKSTASGLESKFRTCASRVPEFVAALSGERYQAQFADSSWDSASMPVFSAVLSTTCRDPGCHIGGDPLYALIGAELASVTEAWPSDPSSGTWPDHDGDGEPGIAISMLGSDRGPYDYPPLDLLSRRRVRSLGLGMRVVVGFDGTLQSCDELRGPTKEGSVETRAVSCQASTSPVACSQSDLSFVNDNLPVWTVRQGAFQAKRLASDADCKDVRRLFARGAVP